MDRLPALGRADAAAITGTAARAEPDDLDEIRIRDLPQITYFERDAGLHHRRCLSRREPDSGVANLSFHRSQIISDTELRIRLGSSPHPRNTKPRPRPQRAARGRHPHRRAARSCSPPPPAPYDESELEIAAKIVGAPLALRRCRTVDLEVPAETEIVIEGRILRTCAAGGSIRRVHGLLRAGRRQPRVRGDRRRCAP
jgi:3-polyprenyl-4-hydroxybenzoate decarboxylase